MKIRWRVEADEWTQEGRKINTEANLALIRHTLEEKGPIILEHRFYRNASAPDRLVFDDFENFTEYLESHGFAGDSLYIWSFADVCREDNTLANAKCPDDNGYVPLRGAY